MHISCKNLKISVIICTYNRAELLKGALDSLSKQTLNAIHYEVLVIDNNSTDLTRNVTLQYSNLLPIRYFLEINQGLSFARNRGYLEAKGEFVAYMDDDARADKDWLSNALYVFNKTTPQPLVIGGPVYPFYLVDKPKWFKDEYESYGYGEDNRFLKKNEPLSGSNMIFKNDVLKKLGGFNTKLGCIGTILWAGEECDLFIRIWEYYNKELIYHSSLLKIFHYVPEKKMVPKYALKRSFVNGQSYLSMLSSKGGILKHIIFLGATIQCFAFILISFVKFFFYKNYENWMYECIAPIFIRIGIILGYLKIIKSVQQ